MSKAQKKQSLNSPANNLTGSVGMIMSALGSVITLYPRTDYSRAYPSKSPAQRMDDAWETTGKQMASTMKRLSYK